MILLPSDLSSKGQIKPAIPPGSKVQFRGHFANLNMKDVAFEKPVTFDLTEATFTGWQLANVRGVNIVGGQGQGNAIIFWNCQDINVTGGTYVGGGPKLSAIRVMTGERISIKEADFSACRTGVGFEKVRDFYVGYNQFEGMFSDGVNVKSGWKGLIERNLIYGTDMSPGAHPDGIQVYSWADAPPCSDIVIDGNVIIGRTEGILLSVHDRSYPVGTVLADGRILKAAETMSDGGFNRITIRGNRTYVSFPNAIVVGRCHDLTLENNHATTMRDPGLAKQYISKIAALECTDVKLKGFNRFDGWAGKSPVVLS